MTELSASSSASPVSPVRCDALSSQSGIDHGFFTRDGGASEGVYRGLNVGIGSDDKRETVLENRRRVAAHFGMGSDALISLYQVHSPDVVVVRTPLPEDDRPKADAIVTDRPGLVLGVLTADCGPVLFSDAHAGVVGAAHAGWKGATGGVLENTISEMENLGAKRERISATLGPTISQTNYEVGPEFVERLKAMAKENSKFLTPSEKPDHAMFDLPGYIVERLSSAGVAARWTGQCTYADDVRFFSYRRTTHRNEPDYGRQVSAIMIKP